jgi:hypothetical protein
MADETIDVDATEFDENGTHAFLFIDHVSVGTTPEQVVRALRRLGKPPVMYASAFVGEFQAFAHLRVDGEGRQGIGELQDLIDSEIIPIGARCHYGVETGVKPLGAKRKSPGLIVLTRVKLTPRVDPQGERETLIGTRDDPSGHPPGFVGVSVMSGDWDLLLQTTGDSLEDAHANVREALSRIADSVVRSSTSFADGDRTAMRYGRIPLRGATEG